MIDRRQKKRADEIFVSGFRAMLWKTQSGIIPPLFYLVIAEKDKLKAVKELMCPKNAVDPANVQSQRMYPVHCSVA